MSPPSPPGFTPMVLKWPRLCMCVLVLVLSFTNPLPWPRGIGKRPSDAHNLTRVIRVVLRTLNLDRVIFSPARHIRI